jgi:DNA-formamidopyrimidine glycosylase
MPESPEVLNYYLYINPILQGERIKESKILSGKYLTKKEIPNIEKVKDLKIVDVIVKGKTIFVKCEKNISIVFVHGMTGYYSTEKEKHSRLVLYLENAELYYNDPRNFGTITVHTTEEEYNKAYDKLGPDILNDDITYEEFYSRIDKKPRLEIGSVLLDQALICGIGNYLRCDILWYCKLNHRRKIGSLTEEEKKTLYNASVNIIRYHAEMSYDLEYEPEEEFFAYMQSEDIFGNDVLTEKYKGRTIHYVEW